MPFSRQFLPELRLIIVEYLERKDLLNYRLASREFRDETMSLVWTEYTHKVTYPSVRNAARPPYIFDYPDHAKWYTRVVNLVITEQSRHDDEFDDGVELPLLARILDCIPRALHLRIKHRNSSAHVLRIDNGISNTLVGWSALPNLTKITSHGLHLAAVAPLLRLCPEITTLDLTSHYRWRYLHLPPYLVGSFPLNYLPKLTRLRTDIEGGAHLISAGPVEVLDPDVSSSSLSVSPEDVAGIRQIRASAPASLKELRFFKLQMNNSPANDLRLFIKIAPLPGLDSLTSEFKEQDAYGPRVLPPQAVVNVMGLELELILRLFPHIRSYHHRRVHVRGWPDDPVTGEPGVTDEERAGICDRAAVALDKNPHLKGNRLAEVSVSYNHSGDVFRFRRREGTSSPGAWHACCKERNDPNSCTLCRAWSLAGAT